MNNHTALSREVVHSKSQMTTMELDVLSRTLNDEIFPLGSFAEIYRTKLGTLTVDITCPDSDAVDVVLLIRDHMVQTVYRGHQNGKIH